MGSRLWVVERVESTYYLQAAAPLGATV